ncbi:MAG: hypothetical protein JSV89_04720 [Spirochaetaceae bacterium]|nr:MAG: hypothetical protein JSV89_04720 [Spirochaetaceae bacterium]
MESTQQDDSFQPIEETEISPDERELVLSQIEAALVQSRTPERADLSILHAEKRGLFLPVLINLTALLLIAAGVLLLSRYFELRKENITLRRSSYLSAEGAVLQTLKQESDIRLQAKEEEISSIQRKLQEVDQEQEALKLKLEADLKTKEEELRKRLEEELSRERERLIALGTSEAGISNQLRDLELREQNSIDREITQYRRQLDAQLQEKERELLQSQRLAQDALVQANRDKDQLLVDLRNEERQRSSAEQRLSELSARVQAETLLEDQAAAVFASLRTNLRAQRFAAAQQDLKGLEDNPVVKSYVVDLLRELMESGQGQSGQGVSSDTVAALEAELAAKTEEIEELQSQIRAIVDASSSDKSKSAVLAMQLQKRIDGLTAELLALRAERDALSVSLQRAQGAQNESFQRGRDDALRDIMTFLNLLSGTAENRGETETQLLTLARQDPLFRAASREIQILIAGGSTGELASPFLFLGVVSSVSSDRVVIEAMVDLDVSVGAVVQIRKISDLETEITIAEGTVQQVRGSKITASFKPLASGVQGPAARDPVYVAAGGS